VPGEDHKDAWQMVWNLWWVRYALEHGHNPFQTDLIFYPQGTGLYLHALNALNGLLSLPIQYLAQGLDGAAAGAVAGYNFIVLFSLTVGAYGAFCLARYLWGDWKAALLAGLAYGFSTYNFDHLLGHLNLVSSEFIPFYILFLLKALHSDRWIRNLLVAVGFLVALMLLELQYVLYMAIFSALYLVYLTFLWLWQKWRKQTPAYQFLIVWGRAASIVVLFGLLTLPLTLPMLHEALNNPNTVPLRQDSIYSADLLAYFYPSPFHPLWGAAMNRAIKPFTATLIEKVVFPGFTVYLLALLGLILSRVVKTSPTVGERLPRPTGSGNLISTPQPEQDKSAICNLQSASASPGFWALTAAAFVVLSLGRRLHLNGVEHGPPLPATLIYQLPILNITRVPARFAVVALLALGLLAAWGLSLVGRWLAGRIRVYNLVVGGALVALAFELLPAPYSLTYYSVPDFYHTLTADPRSDYAILDVPLNYGRYQYETAYLEAQMTHHKPLLNGYISRNPVYPPYYGLPTLLNFRDLTAALKPDIIPAQPPDAGVLRYFGVRYISIHKDILSGGERDQAFGIISKLLSGQSPVADDSTMTVYEVPSGPKTDFFYNLVLPDWHEAEKGADGKMSRWVSGDKARLDFWTTTSRRIEIEFTVRSFQQTRPVEFWLDANQLEQVQLGLQPQTIKLTLDLKPGQNQLSLKIGGPAYRPVDLGLGADTRSLTISVGEVTITP
jgi:hypothetical protein